jgi:predicted nucleic acid-binding Zn ribbon protein
MARADCFFDKRGKMRESIVVNNHCKVCGKELVKNNFQQVVYYCSSECRYKRFPSMRRQNNNKGITNGKSKSNA